MGDSSCLQVAFKVARVLGSRREGGREGQKRCGRGGEREMKGGREEGNEGGVGDGESEGKSSIQ